MAIIYILYALAALGVADTLYLIYHKLRGTDVACILFPPEWCKKVQYAKQSKTFGISNAYLGFGMYVAIIVLAYLFATDAVPAWPLQIVVTIGFLFSMYFTYIQGFVLKAFCTWCVISAINFSVMLVLVWAL